MSECKTNATATRRPVDFRTGAAFLLGLLAVLGLALLYAGQTGANFCAHSPVDSYTLQALAWRAGKTTLDGEMPWLELAIYQGRQFLSFPPVPTLPMLALSFFFGENTPSGLATLFYLLTGYAAGFCLARRRMGALSAALLSVLACAGGSLMDVAVSGSVTCGGVWYQAQMLAFALTMLSFLLLDGERKAGWHGGLICFALAIGCRPLNIAAAPALLWLLWQKLRGDGKPVRAIIREALPMAVVPVAIGCAYGFYNLARFDNFFQFGHAYLPEYVESGDTVFALSNLGVNLQHMLRWPRWIGGTLTFPTTCGFAAPLTQPILTVCLFWFLLRAVRGRVAGLDATLLGCLTAQLLLLCLHRTFGGWQYGTRYLCDLLPAAFYLRVRLNNRMPAWEAALLVGAGAFNLTAGVLFHMW